MIHTLPSYGLPISRGFPIIHYLNDLIFGFRQWEVDVPSMSIPSTAALQLRVPVPLLLGRGGGLVPQAVPRQAVQRTVLQLPRVLVLWDLLSMLLICSILIYSTHMV